MQQTSVPGTPSYKRPLWRRLLRWAIGLLALLAILLLIAAGGIWHVYETRLRPEPEEWQYTLHVNEWNIPLSIPKTLDFASNPAYGSWLNWLPFDVRKETLYGRTRLFWDDSSQSLGIFCSPCQVQWDSTNPKPLHIEQARILIHQEKPGVFSGAINIGPRDKSLLFTWESELKNQDTLLMDIAGNNVEIKNIYDIFVPDIPELKHAHITGTVTLGAQVTLPHFSLSLSTPQTDHFTVSGLGTEQLLNATSACGKPSNLPMNHWLVRSVMSAEDQRFEEHPGYDLQALMAAHDANQQQGAIVRGGSTITQQTAKLLFTGSERTLTRKLRELLYAVEIEQTLGKTRIMQVYLDNAPWGAYADGSLLCGAEAAAQHYFNRKAVNLRPEQAVWLAAMLHSPVAEARAWQRTGKINLPRAIWIAEYVRNAPNSGPRARQNVIDTLRRPPGLGMKPQSSAPVRRSGF